MSGSETNLPALALLSKFRYYILHFACESLENFAYLSGVISPPLLSLSSYIDGSI